MHVARSLASLPCCLALCALLCTAAAPARCASDDAAAPAAADAPAVPADALAPAPKAEPSLQRRLAPWVMGGAALTSLGAGLVFALEARSTSQQLTGQVHSGALSRQLLQTESAQKQASGALLVAGAGFALLTGALLTIDF